MRFIKDAIKTFTISTVATLGALTAVGIWEGGFGDKVEEKTRKIFKKKEES